MTHQDIFTPEPELDGYAEWCETRTCVHGNVAPTPFDCPECEAAWVADNEPNPLDEIIEDGDTSFE